MPDGSIKYILLFLVFIIGGGYFAGAEISLASVNKIHMMTAADNGSVHAKRVLTILDRFDEALSAMLIGNNIMQIGCATLATVLATEIARATEWSTTSAVTLSTVVTTVALFLFAEMIPKCFAKSCNEKFAMAISGSLLFLMKVLHPLSMMFTAFSGLLTKPFLRGKKPEVTVTEDELQEIVDSIGEKESGFDEDTAELVQSAMDFSNATATDVMIPWDEVVKVSTVLKADEILALVKQCGHSRLPVVDRRGEVKGILQIRKFLKAYISGRRNLVLAGLTDRPFYCDADKSVDDALTHLSSHKRNLAILRDKDKKVLGIITVEDILETLVGEIYDEEDQSAPEDGGQEK